MTRLRRVLVDALIAARARILEQNDVLSPTQHSGDAMTATK